MTVFGYEPNFRAIANGSARLLLQAILRTPTGSVPSTTTQIAQGRTVHHERASDVLRLGHTRAWRLADDGRQGGRPDPARN